MDAHRSVRGLAIVLGLVCALGVACTPTTATPEPTTTTTTSTTSTTSTTTSTTTTLPPEPSSVTPNPIPVPASPQSGAATVTVHFAGLLPGFNVYVEQCRAYTSLGLDCSAYDPQVVLAGANTTGSGTLSFDLFRGAEPDARPWGCFAPTDSPISGVEFDTTCYLRITDISAGNDAHQQLLPFTFVAS